MPALGSVLAGPLGGAVAQTGINSVKGAVAPLTNLISKQQSTPTLDEYTSEGGASGGGETGAPSALEGQIPYFHHLLCQWATAIPLPFFWIVMIQPEDEDFFIQELQSVGRYEFAGGWDLDGVFQEVWNEGVQKKVGCTFAHGVDTVGDSVAVSYAGIQTNNNGFLRGPIANGRADQSLLSISFIETNSSFADFCVRPWAIMTGHLGMIAHPEKNIKATIDAYFLAKNGRDKPPVVRKRISYRGCQAVSVDPEKYTYGDTGVIYRQCQFAHSGYTVNAT